MLNLTDDARSLRRVRSSCGPVTLVRSANHFGSSRVRSALQLPAAPSSMEAIPEKYRVTVVEALSGRDVATVAMNSCAGMGWLHEVFARHFAAYPGR